MVNCTYFVAWHWTQQLIRAICISEKWGVPMGLPRLEKVGGRLSVLPRLAGNAHAKIHVPVLGHAILAVVAN